MYIRMYLDYPDRSDLAALSIAVPVYILLQSLVP